MESGNEPATKQDIAELRAELRAEMKAMEDRLIEAFRDAQTEILKAFYSFAQSAQERFKATDESEASMKKRLGIIEERLTELERRSMMPPPQ